MIDLWKEGRTRFTNRLSNIKSEDFTKNLGDSPNSAGFLIRHIAEVELLFAKNVFGNMDVKVDTLLARIEKTFSGCKKSLWK